MTRSGNADLQIYQHQYFRKEGFGNVSFTGLDIAPLAPDLKKHGVDWRFVLHDLRKWPLPFKDEEFDLIFINNEFIGPVEGASFNPVTSLTRYLRPGGIVEIWKSDLQFRCMQPDPPIAAGASAEDVEQAERTKTYTISAATPFAKTQNKFIQDCNVWIEKVLRKHGLTATPWFVLSEPSFLHQVFSWS